MTSKSGATWDLPAVAAAMSTASIDSTKWVRAMDVIVEQTGSIGAALVPGTGLPNNVFSEPIAGLSDAYFREGWSEDDLRFRGLPVMRDKGVFDERRYTTGEEIGKPNFQDLHRFGLR